ncbi:Rpn family recombination-promoting nuclease/putative transposase [Cohnella cellulosilytica]|uniref:Rpn family recombination-promoting nuclease/putative transposase n=1 Tax=Cohnella cellulosilytica TaxID=986710 RepID=A0ABW2FN46_9BACL
MSIDHDRLFKELLQTFFKEFMELFFPKVSAIIDYSHVKFLSEELFSGLVGGTTERADLVVETLLLEEEGTEATEPEHKALIIIHLEPQSYFQEDFPERMFLYSGKLYEKYRRRILPIAVFSHSRQLKEPPRFGWAFPFLKVVTFRYYAIQLRKKSWRRFVKTDNPVAAALLSSMGYNKKERVAVKFEFLRMMTRLRLDPARMRLLTVFFETYLQLTNSENERLLKKIDRTNHKEEAAIMEWMTSWEKMGLEKGLKQGVEQGREEGREEGILKSKEEIAAKMLAKGLDPAMVEEMTGLSADRINKLKESVH